MKQQAIKNREPERNNGTFASVFLSYAAFFLHELKVDKLKRVLHKKKCNKEWNETLKLYKKEKRNKNDLQNIPENLTGKKCARIIKLIIKFWTFIYATTRDIRWGNKLLSLQEFFLKGNELLRLVC